MCADIRIVLADTCGEDQNIQTVHGCCISADILDHAVDEHLTRQVSTFVALIDSRFDITAVTRNTAHAQQTGFLIHEVVKLCSTQVLFIHDKRSCSEVKVAGASTHHKTFHRRQTHAGVYARTVHDSSAAAATTDVGGNDLLFLRIHTKELTYASTYITVTRSVETIAANRIFLV